MNISMRDVLVTVTLIVALNFVIVEGKNRHHRRSISYDDRWFGFEFVKEPSKGLLDSTLTVLPCSFSLHREREANVEWRKDGTPISLSDKRQVASNGSLIVRNAVQTDEGVYQCIVKVSDREGSSWVFVSRKAPLRLPSSLRWKNESSDVKGILGKTFAINCQLDDSSNAALQWLKNGKHLTKKGRISFLGEKQTILEVGEASKADEGVYKCVWKRGGDKVERSTKVSLVQDSPELSFVNRPVNERISEGSQVVFHCLAQGEASLKTDWTKDGKPIDEDTRIAKIGVSSLVVSNVRVEDAGVYTCKVSDSTDSIESSATLSVLSAPYITSRPQDVIAMESSDVELECFANGHPSPALLWFKNGEMLVASEYFVIESNKLRILGLVKTDQGIYECLVENEMGSAHAEAQVIVDSTGYYPPSAPQLVGNESLRSQSENRYADDSLSIAAHSGSPSLPSAPLGLRVMSLSSRETTLTWDPPLHRHGSLLHYFVYYKEEDSQRERVVNSSTLSTRIVDLQPSTTYSMRVAVENEAGIGASSNTISVTTKEEQEMPGRVTDLRARAVGPETVEVEWKKPSGGGASAVRYRLFYVRTGDSAEAETQINVPSTAYTMHGMDKYTSYNIRVEAEGEKGVGLSSDTVVVRTLSDSPSSPPIDISALPLSTTSVKITWKVDESHTNGPLLGARMKYKTKGRGSKPTTLVIDGTVTEYTIDSLEPGTSYQLRIALFNNNGTGPYSEWISFETPLTEKDESVLGAPLELRALAHVDSVSLQWKPPSDESVLVRGYQIGWGLNVPDVEHARVESTVHEYRITGLKPSRDYVISVRAFNREGLGFPIYETVRTWAHRQEEREEDGVEGSVVLDAPLGVQANAESPTSLRITWADNPSTFNAVYTVKYMSRSELSSVRYVNTSDTWVVIDKLKPGTEYEIAVRAMMPPSAQSPWSMTVSHSTSAAPPSSAPRDLTILPASSGDPHAVTVNWQPPKYANGEMEEYIVYYTDRPTAHDEDWISVRVPADRLSIPINNLLPRSTYYFRIQGRNVKGLGPMSPNQVYSPLSPGFIHPAPSPIRPGGKSAVAQLIDQIGKSLIMSVVAIGVVLVILISLFIICICVCKRMSSKSGSSSARKASERRANDLWIQHGVGGASSHLLAETPSLAELKNGRAINTESPPPRYHTGTIHRGEDPYACVVPRVRVSLSSYEESSADSSRPLVPHRSQQPPHHSSHQPAKSSVPSTPLHTAPSIGEDSERSGTLSRSYEHSTTSLDQRQRTPQMVYSGQGRGAMSKLELVESPYGSSMGLAAGTPPPPCLAPPLPPLVTADGYRSIRGINGGTNGLRSFSQNRQPAQRMIPVGRATAQPRVNVASLCSPYVSTSGMSVEEEKMRMKEVDEGGLEDIQQSLSSEQLNDDVDNIDHMISDLQALQQQFGVN